MKYYLHHHQHKGKQIDKALRAMGHIPVRANADIGLFDHDCNREIVKEGGMEIPSNEPRAMLKRIKDEGSKIVLYPHSVLPPWWYDGIFKWEAGRIDSILVIGEGHRKATQVIIPDADVKSIGWSFCPQRKFIKPKSVRRILFAPVHPPMRGTLRPDAAQENARANEMLKKIAEKRTVIVRHIHSLATNNLTNCNKFIYRNGKPDGSFDDIDNADLVIAEGTFMYLAVARGKPVIGLNQHNPLRGNNLFHKYPPEKWGQYAPYFKYPLDMSDGKIEDLIYQAVAGEQEEWRANCIGNDMTPQGLSRILEEVRK